MDERIRIFQTFFRLARWIGAFTYSNKEKNAIIDYIKNQKEHHKIETFNDEYKRLLTEHEIEFDEKYLL